MTHQRLSFTVNSARRPVSDLLQIEPESPVTAWSLISVYVRVTLSSAQDREKPSCEVKHMEIKVDEILSV